MIVDYFNDIEWKYYDGSEQSLRIIKDWIFDLARSGQFSIATEDGKLHINPGVYVVQTSFGLVTRK